MGALGEPLLEARPRLRNGIRPGDLTIVKAQLPGMLLQIGFERI
jgi:hypothetical protein